MTKELAIRIIEIDARIELLLSGKWQVVSGDNENEIEKLKQQKIQLYEDSCNSEGQKTKSGKKNVLGYM